MNTTPNYGLGLPLVTERYDVSVFNTNASIVDTALATKQNTLIPGTNITISGNTISAKDTTYSSLSPSQGSADVSLVTRGEKYTWNHKADESTLATVAFSGDYNDLDNKPTVNPERLTAAQVAYLQSLL